MSDQGTGVPTMNALKQRYREGWVYLSDEEFEALDALLKEHPLGDALEMKMDFARDNRRERVSS